MQKLSSYLYPNRVPVNVISGAFETEWRIVYQRNVKIYQGLDNTIEFDFKNDQQRRIDITGKTLRCIILDEAGRQLTEIPVTASPLKGIGTLTIPKAVGDIIKPQFLYYIVVSIDEHGNKIPVYADTQFGLQGKMELIGNIFPHLTTTIDFTTFTHDTTGFYFHDVNLNTSNLQKISIEAASNLLDGSVSFQTATDTTVNQNTAWTSLEDFDINANTVHFEKTYSTFDPAAKWLRVRYENSTLNTGTFDRIIVRLYYTV